jgi:AmmeMemoRadiSam system protein A
MIVYGLISPHPPIIIPEVGGGEIKKVHRTITALESAAGRLAAAQPDELVIISPHEGHGFEVPMYYLGRHLPASIEVQEILVTEPSYEYYYEFGKTLGAKLQRERRRYAIVASGDLSHVLAADGPYGFHPAGPRLDQAIVKAVRAGGAEALLALDPTMLDDGAECGLRSILFLLGALDGTEFAPRVLSYEGPFGVGYLVATYETTAYTIMSLARQAARHYLETSELLPVPKPLPKALRRPAGAFVTLHEPDGDLRGCIGTTEPTRSSLAAEIIANAAAAATADPRFDPVTPAELGRLVLSVDVLSAPVPASGRSQLDPKRYGLIVAADDGRRGVLLPNLDDVTTVEEQIAICRQKGGIGPTEPVELFKFEVARYSELLSNSASIRPRA